MREKTIDIAKGWGMFFVVLGHLTIFGSPLYIVIYHFHMPLFFFLSGWLFKHTSVKKCMIKKTKRLLLPYMFYWFYIHLIQYIWYGIVFSDWNVAVHNWNPLCGGTLWFLISLWSINLIVAVSYKMGKWQYAIYLLLFIIGLIMGEKKIQLPLYASQTMLMLPFFIMGMFFHKKTLLEGQTIYEYLSKRGILSWEFLVAILLFFVPCGLLDINGPVIPNPVQFILTPLSGIIIILIVSRQFSSLWQKMRIDKLGANSLQIYGIHWPLVPFFWFITIPIVMRITSVVGENLQGMVVKDLVFLQVVLAIILTTVSHLTGVLFVKMFPQILK